MIWKWAKQRYTKNMQLDPEKIGNILRNLNGTNGHDWIVADGFHALTSVDIHDDGHAIFNPGSGIPTKAFVNTRTGEIRLYHVDALKLRGKDG